MPGHTNAALASYAELNPDGKKKPVYTGIDVGFSSLMYREEITYDFVEDVIREISAISPSKRIGATAKSGLENGGNLQGSLDEVKILNRALNDSEIAEIPVIEVNKSELTTAINNANEVKAFKSTVIIVVNKINKLIETNTTSNSTTLSWEEPASVFGLVEYVIYKDGNVLETVSAGTVEYEVTKLRTNTIYGLKVSAKYSNDEESKLKSVNIRTKKYLNINLNYPC